MSEPSCTGWSSISFMRSTAAFVEITAARLFSAPCRGSYSLEATIMNMKKVSTSISPEMSSAPPVMATEAIPSFRIMPEELTKTAVLSSEMMERFSTARILDSSPSR